MLVKDIFLNEKSKKRYEGIGGEVNAIVGFNGCSSRTFLKLSCFGSLSFYNF